MFDFLGVLTYCAYVGECSYSHEIPAEGSRAECQDVGTLLPSGSEKRRETGHKHGRLLSRQRHTQCSLNSPFNFL